jgi:hypothetical protein
LTSVGNQPARNSGMTILLKPFSGGRPIVLDKPILLVGRHPDCDIILKESPKVSRKHCCLALVDNRFVVRDRVEHSSDVKFGQELMIGDVRFELVNTNGAKKKAAREPKPEAKVLPKLVDAAGQTADVSVLQGGDKVEFSSAFAVPITESSQDDDFIPLADMED